MALAEKAKAKINGQNAAYLHIFTGAEMWRLFYSVQQFVLALAWRDWKSCREMVARSWRRMPLPRLRKCARLGRSNVDGLAPNGAFSVFAFPVFRVLRAVF